MCILIQFIVVTVMAFKAIPENRLTNYVEKMYPSFVFRDIHCSFSLASNRQTCLNNSRK